MITRPDDERTSGEQGTQIVYPTATYSETRNRLTDISAQERA
jgi:hypothetical protein